jgi:predicted Rossmann-fold nucleotide-binding protein
MIGWLRETVAREGKIDPGDLDLFHVVDDPAAAARLIIDARGA